MQTSPLQLQNMSVKFELKSELSQSSSYLYLEFIPFLEGHISVKKFRRKTHRKKNKKKCTL